MAMARRIFHHLFCPLALVNRATIVLLLSCLCIFHGVALAAGEEPPAQENEVPRSEPPVEEPVATENQPTRFAPVIADPTDFDWIKLTSGEWLKGEIIVFRQDRLTFDSDKLGELTFDWNDVDTVQSPHQNTVLFEGRITATGTLLIHEGVVIVGGEEPKQFNRSDLMTIVPGVPKEINYWSGKLSVGFDFRSGNTNQRDLTAYLLIRRRTTVSRFELTYNGAIGTLEGKASTNNHRTNGKFDRFITKHLYLTLVSMEAFRDPFQNIAYRLLPGAGIGYTAYETKDTQWDFTLGGGARYTRYESVAEGQSDSDFTGAVLAGTSYDTDVTEWLDIFVNYGAQIGVPFDKGTDHHLLTQLSFDLTDLFKLDISVTWDHVGRPVADAEGVVPKKDDVRMTLGLGVDF